MGAFRSQIEALGARQFYDGSDTFYSNESGYDFTRPTFGPTSQALRVSGSARQPPLVKTETNPHVPGGFFLADARGVFNLHVERDDPPDQGTLTFTARFERDGTTSFGSPDITPDVLTDGGTAYEAITGDRAGSRGFFQVQFRQTVAEGATIPVGFWDLHVTDADTIGIATFSDKGWGDLRVDYTNATTQDRWGYRKCYVFDTGFPAGELFDGRPHLVTIRFLAQNQYNPDASPALVQDNWIKLSIDGTNLPATTRGPALTGFDGVPNITAGAHAFDEVVFWDRALSDAETSSMWGDAVWGTDTWPYLGAGVSSASMGHCELSQSLTRVVDWEYTWNQPRAPQIVTFLAAGSDVDPVWIQNWADEIPTVELFLRDDMGQGSWTGVPAWSPSLDQEGADKWLDDQDVALAGWSRGESASTGELQSAEAQLVGVASGHASASASLGIHVPLAASPIAGSSQVYAITIGDLATLAARTDGSSVVVGELVVGEREDFAGTSQGSSTASGALGVKPYSLITGGEIDDNGMPIPAGSVRVGRKHFSPKSSGRANKTMLVGS